MTGFREKLVAFRKSLEIVGIIMHLLEYFWVYQDRNMVTLHVRILP